ncbi:Phosphatidylinositol mannoside acyltransferase [Stackebrandtia soli]
MLIRTMRDSVIGFGYAAAWRLVRAMPESVAGALFRAAADRATRRNGASVRQLRRNLRRVVGPEVSNSEMDALVRDAMRSYARYWCESFRLPSYGRQDILDRFMLDGYEVFDKHRAEGTGVIMAIPHSGNWDLAGAWVTTKGYPLTTVVERLRPDSVFESFVEFRRGLGMEIVPHTGGERPARTVLAERLAQGHVVPIVADRDLSSNGVEVDFFGEKTRMPVGPALLAIRTKAPLYTVVVRNDGPHRGYGKVEGPIPIPTDGRLADRVAAVTQAMADAFAAGIAVAPADWHMLQRLWLSDLPVSPSTTE